MIKSVILILTLFITALSCNNPSSSSQQPGSSDDTSVASEEQNASPQVQNVKAFSIENIPVSDKDLGTFPFFSLPEGLKPLNKPIQRKYDQLFFPLDSVMTPIEGKVWKTFVTPKSGNYDDWSLPFFERSYDEAITDAGGVKVFDGKVSQSELDRIKDQATYFGEEGSIDYWNEPVRVYVIHRADGGDVYIQLSGNTAGGEIQIYKKSRLSKRLPY